ncbi:MAG TPA: prephenate dehydrogenase/arogenate dehydrogenase family protein [Burkholderiales bacterium]|jgi:prephenate dehydrogenase|nr:prephenate dehydrogenase/arogenate dehydrogenase family protein [Burkholderiales bacterium]
MAEFRSDRLVVIGVGLIGGSVAAALRKAGCVKHVVGVGRSAANMARARELGVIDEIAGDPASAARDADTVLLAVPVQQNERVLGALSGALAPGALLTDAGSTKQDFVAAARRLAPARLAGIVPGHPIAGAEHTGVDAASPTLFQGRNVVLTPLPENAAAAVDRAEALWRSCGARVTRMSPQHHDRVFSAVSHLPHMLAYALVHMIATRPDAEELFGFAASGFRDFTRIAGSSPEMWRDIATANREALVADLEAYQAQVAALTERLRAGDGAELERLFEAARRARSDWLARSASR